ncbi:MAG: cation diffusion facilitator family transporter [Planctomycetia bacterium]|nr:cation diffusion facilitator family transporter [Planctomycetia bacterium]
MNLLSEKQNPFTEQEQTSALNRITWFGMIINFLLTILKFLAGVFAHSQVLIADAVHSLSDLITDLALLIGVRFWNRPADSDHPNGHAKLETMITLFIGSVLFLVGLGLIKSGMNSIHDIISGHPLDQPGSFALVAACISIVLKEWLYRITRQCGIKYRSSALIANAWHHRSDALSSIPAAVAVLGCLLFGKQYAFLDPVGTILVSCMILYAAFEIVRPAFSTLIDQGIPEDKVEVIRKEVLSFDSITDVHKIRTRPLGSGRYAIDLHIHVDPEMSVRKAHHLSHEIQDSLCAKNSEIVDVVVHVEPNILDDSIIEKQ